jgi:hypothetical protein
VQVAIISIRQAISSPGSSFRKDARVGDKKAVLATIAHRKDCALPEDIAAARRND